MKKKFESRGVLDMNNLNQIFTLAGIENKTPEPNQYSESEDDQDSEITEIHSQPTLSAVDEIKNELNESITDKLSQSRIVDTTYFKHFEYLVLQKDGPNSDSKVDGDIAYLTPDGAVCSIHNPYKAFFKWLEEKGIKNFDVMDGKVQYFNHPKLKLYGYRLSLILY